MWGANSMIRTDVDDLVQVGWKDKCVAIKFEQPHVDAFRCRWLSLSSTEGRVCVKRNWKAKVQELKC